MYVIKYIFSHIYRNTSLYFFIFLAIFTIDRHHRYEISSNPKEYGPFELDVAEYYSFLPTFFYQNSDSVSINFKKNKRTVGMAIMYSPAFLVGHAIAACNGEIKDGYSEPYKWSIRWGSIIYCILGLLFCRKSLLLFFDDIIVSISLICILFGTNLFFYTYCYGEMPHSYLFFLYSAFIYSTLQFVNKQKYQNLIWIGLISGLIILIRPTDIIILLFPLTYKINSVSDIKERFRSFTKHYFILALSLLLFALPILFQLFIWKKYIGNYIYYSYTDEKFFFNDPQILNFLFSYQKGWLLYTPIMVFSIIGIILSKKYMKDLFIPLILITSISIYILSCWFDWAFGGSFGCRPLVQLYALLIFPFALFISKIWNLFEDASFRNLISKIVVCSAFFLLIQFNLFQIMQAKYLQIHWSGMNAKIYKYVFLNSNITERELKYLHSIATPLDYVKLKKGERGLPF